MAGFYGALVEAIKIEEVQDDDDDDVLAVASRVTRRLFSRRSSPQCTLCIVRPDIFQNGTRDRIAGIIRELAESEKGRAGVVAAGALLAAFMIEIARSDGLMTSLELAKTILKLSKSVEGREWLVAAGGCGALAQALRIDDSDFEIFNHDCREDFWELERCNESALRKLRNNKK